MDHWRQVGPSTKQNALFRYMQAKGPRKFWGECSEKNSQQILRAVNHHYRTQIWCYYVSKYYLGHKTNSECTGEETTKQLPQTKYLDHPMRSIPTQKKTYNKSGKETIVSKHQLYLININHVINSYLIPNLLEWSKLWYQTKNNLKNQLKHENEREVKLNNK